MAVTRVQASHLAQAAAHGVALALSLRAQESKQEFHLPPHIICGLPAYLFEVELKSDRAGNVTVGAIADAKSGGL
jgi:hypothetical protein